MTKAMQHSSGVPLSRRQFLTRAFAAGKYGNHDCAAYRDMRELLALRTDIDAMLIATGDRWHAPASILAMQAGKDVYCEKPGALTIAQGQALVATTRRYGRVFQTGAQRASEANFILAGELVRQGRLGKIQYEGTEVWIAIADGYGRPDVSSPLLLSDYQRLVQDYTARTQRPLNHVRNFLDCVRSRRSPVTGAEVAHRTMTTNLIMDICLDLKRDLKWIRSGRNLSATPRPTGCVPARCAPRGRCDENV